MLVSEIEKNAEQSKRTISAAICTDTGMSLNGRLWRQKLERQYRQRQRTCQVVTDRRTERWRRGNATESGLQLVQHLDGRGERIRTSGLYVPNVALYQAKLHPELTQ